jgi:hypothetical protein
MTRTAFVTTIAALLAASLAQAGPYRAPRTAFGQPDLQGVWTNISLTSLERPTEFQTLVVPRAEAADFDNRRGHAPPQITGDPVGGVDTEWYDGATLARIGGQARSSWIVDPPDGRLPYSAAGRAALAAAMAHDRRTDTVETRPVSERCLLGTGGVAGPPLLNTRYNSNVEIVQTAHNVALLVEMNHDVRVIRLRDRAHPPADVRLWMGDSVGWWEGDTLVAETTNFRPEQSLRWLGVYLSPQARVTERFRRISPAQILYEFTVDDPATFTRTWSAQMPLNAGQGPIYEYACHEGNYALPLILAGARRAEAEGQAHAPAAH